MSSPTTQVPLVPARLPVVAGAGMTHRGLVRSVNEDAILTDPGGTLWAVADGMGGHGHGDIASDIVIDSLSTIEDGTDPQTELRGAITAANDRMLAEDAARGGGRMGSTVVATLIHRAVAHIAWVGDSRAYLWRRGRLGMMTRDHSLVQDLVDRGGLSAEEAEDHPDSHIVTRAVGGGPEIEIDMVAVLLTPGDWLLLCSDGLTRVVYETRIGAILGTAATPQDACQALVQAALEAGAPDNVSVIALNIRESPSDASR